MNQPIVIITGASRGLGAAIAKIAAKLGAKVVLNARSADALETVAQSIQDEGGTALAVPADVSQPDECQYLVDAAVSQFGRLDALVNNAGILHPIAPIADAEPLGWQENLGINLLGPVLLTQAALPHLRQRNGRAIHISSGAAINAIPGWGAYSVAKAGLNHFNKILAAEEPNITTLTVRPGVVDTEMQALIRNEGSGAMPPERYTYFVDLHRQGKLLPPEKPGRAVALLALHAPPAWSGEFIQWDDERINRLEEEA